MKIVFLCKTDDDGFRCMIRLPAVVDAKAWFSMSPEERGRNAENSIMKVLSISPGAGQGPSQVAIAGARGSWGFMAQAMCRFYQADWGRLQTYQQYMVARAAIMNRLMFGWCRASARRHHGKQQPAEGWAYRSSQEP